MNINRHNYETFFLLYVDKELSAADTKAVDIFVDANPDLKAELQMLQEVIISPEEINVDFKRSLLKEENISALQEKLLLFVDEELDTANKNALQLELRENALAAAELNILQQTKLLPDTNIIFSDKNSLYRKEPARVVDMKWWRIAAAAVILGFGIWGATGIYNRQDNKASDKGGLVKSIDINGTSIIKSDPNNLPFIDTTSNIATQQQQHLQTTADVRTQNKSTELTPIQNISVAQQSKVVNEKVKEEKANMVVAIASKKETNNLPTPLENFNALDRNKNNTSIVTPTQSNNAKESQKDIALVPSETKDKFKSAALTEQTAPIAKAAVYNEGDDNAVAMQDQQTKHSKFGGFLRKVKRIVERTTKIKTGEEDVIKVAGFDIAIK